MSKQPNKVAHEYLTQDIQAAERELAALAAQFELLEGKREGLTRKIKALRAEIGEPGQTSLTLSNGNGSVDLSDLLHESASPSKTGFRDRIRQVLGASQRGMRPRDVLNAVRGLGYTYEGVRDPYLRTQRELYRMARNGQINKRGELYYTLKQQVSN